MQVCHSEPGIGRMDEMGGVLSSTLFVLTYAIEKFNEVQTYQGRQTSRGSREIISSLHLNGWENVVADGECFTKSLSLLLSLLRSRIAPGASRSTSR